ncbi:hypothetical protein GCM10010168_17300 [Actinoplanes ianthinogenes]|uniref:Uncharacterized protein n=1 Tax=Actinoplanes ianthinogenes TaxID=122358 RepID=A0ABN6CT17_9ACTN|nr:hypothetical protein [Actinoplanes ianthinogenes]BCJ47372.1 hypothetical protein Aiant_80290 [Actinoplanes ianthinogenes]GGR01367.1 hypothetical protein GCM10010168_17300 [Actinoplanes ianthinogenes]
MRMPGKPSPLPPWQGTEQRLTSTLAALGIPPDGVSPLPPGRLLVGTLGDPPGMVRVRRGVQILVAPPGVDLLAATAAFWQSGGCEIVQQDVPGRGRLLAATDPDGYGLVLTLGDGDAPTTLVVAGPPMRRSDNSLIFGVLAGVILGPLASCVSFTQAQGSSRHAILVYAWLPVLLAVSGLLVAWPKSRRFGVGLLIGGAVTGLVLSGICFSAL